MISYDKDTVFHINFEAKEEGKWTNVYGTTMFFNYLPRMGDIIDVDSCLMRVLFVEYGYKSQFNPTVRVEQLGHFEEYSRNHL
ncbi:hypothetical protein G3444_10445 [Shewanella baltica]|jgi:hypothetical protein|uniref:hypothetical protein n=1 Tax=Shewanella TaxID=22 RepID=UPI000CF6ED39|nr:MULTISPECIES: hypothetical protein [Shewanella]AVI66630.1 hypothetical protein CKQ84_12450 [Shewanella sp. WE21]MCS6119322.1 hypothetical protein [Shewanella baltica]